jgi:excisionase family DNA binding protein
VDAGVPVHLIILGKGIFVPLRPNRTFRPFDSTLSFDVLFPFVFQQGHAMEFLTVYQASKYLRVSSKTVSRWIDEGSIAATTTGDGHLRIRRKDLHAFLRRQGLPIPREIEISNLGRKRILVIDDDRLIVETIVAALQEEPYDYEIISASDGFEAGVQVRELKPDLLILDIMMPDIDGYEVCRNVKEHEATAETKIIVLSAYLDDENYEKMKGYGADACFAKPLSLKALKREVKRMLEMEEQD